MPNPTIKTVREISIGIAQAIFERFGLTSSIHSPSAVEVIHDSLRHQLGADTSHVEGHSYPDGCKAPTTRVVSSGAMAEQVGGGHYKGMKIQHAEFCQANNLKWCESAAIKYLCRHKEKNKIEDLRKALHYVRICAKLEYGEDI